MFGAGRRATGPPIFLGLLPPIGQFKNRTFQAVDNSGQFCQSLQPPDQRVAWVRSLEVLKSCGYHPPTGDRGRDASGFHDPRAQHFAFTSPLPTACESPNHIGTARQVVGFVKRANLLLFAPGADAQSECVPKIPRPLRPDRYPLWLPRIRRRT